MMSTFGEASGSAPLVAQEDRPTTVRAVAELRHPHIVAMRPSAEGFEFDREGGRSLAELLAARGGYLPLRAALRILLDTLSGLSALHRAQLGGKPLNFVHGEVTPENILVGRDGVARLVPLVASHWSSASVPSAAAVGYIAPEKLLGDKFDQRADVFSIGVLLWEAMARKRLFRDLEVDDVVTQLVGGKVRPPAAASDAPWSAELSDVAMRALAVDPADRWEHVGMMGADIETISLGHLARSSELIAMVTGREVSRDSMSDEVTMPLASLSSLSPFANSIPSTSDDSVTTKLPELTPRGDSTLPIEAPALHPSRDPMPERTRFKIVASSLAVSLLLLAMAGYKKMSRPPDVEETTVLGPASQPTPAMEPSSDTVAAQPTEPAAPVNVPPPPTQAKPAEPRAPQHKTTEAASPKPVVAQDAKGARLAPKAPAPPATAKPGESGKPNEDPFGLMKPVKTKPKADPFGL